jgi:hypothetical protein
MTLFESHTRTDLDAAFHAETTFAYLNRSARPEIVALRDLWEEWFCRYPQNSTDDVERTRAALRSRFRSRRDRQQREAFWELYLHESLVRAQCHVTVRTDTPDFDVRAPDGFVFHLEATVRGASDSETADDARIAVLRDGLDRTRAPDWRLDVGARTETERPAPTAIFRREIEAWLSSLDVASVLADCEAHGPEAFARLPCRTFERDGWSLDVRALPRQGPLREGRPNAVGVWGTGEVIRVRNAERLVDSLTTKATAVRGLSAPVVVAVLLDREFGRVEHIEDALYGTETTEIAFDPNRLAIAGVREVRADDGVWTRSNVHGRRVDAVLGGIRLHPFSVSRSVPVLWTNPWLRRDPLPLPASLPWERRWVDQERTFRRAGSASVAEFFALPISWPE